LIAVELAPVIIALSGKYSIITLITVFSDEGLNVLHKYLVYICLALSVAHTVPYIAQPLRDGGYAVLYAPCYAARSSEYSGTPPLGTLAFLYLFSIPWTRHRFYETFAHSHIIALIVYIGLMSRHTTKKLDSFVVGKGGWSGDTAEAP